MKRAGTRCVPALFLWALACWYADVPPVMPGPDRRAGRGRRQCPLARDARREGTSGKRRGFMSHQVRKGCRCGKYVVPVDGRKGCFPVWAALRYCFLMVSVEPMDALMMAERAAHWARLSCSPRKRNPERAASAGSRLMRMLNVREGRFFSAMISTP